MLSKKIIASNIRKSNIRNLTDARYFAAWMVEYMSFDISAGSEAYIGPENIKEIIDWLEGPEFLGNFCGHEDMNFIIENKKALSLSGVITDKKSVVDAWDFAQGKLFYCTNEFEVLQNLDTMIITEPKTADKYINVGQEVFIDSKAFSLELLDDPKLRAGFCLEGGEEIKTGLKSFDELDDIFEFLAD